MNLTGSLRELEDQLPHGFHDARLLAVGLDFPGNAARLDLEVHVGDSGAPALEARATYRKATLWLHELVYFAISPPGPKGEWSADGGLWVHEADDAEEEVHPPRPLPEEVPAGRFLIPEWNAFLHVAARSATLTWGERPS